MNKTKSFFKVFYSILALFLPSLMLSITTYAVNVNGGLETGVEQGKGRNVPSTLFGNVGIFNQVINIMLFLVGILSIIMLIFGGLRYVISGGNSKTVESAKNTILYAIIGLIVAILAYAIVNFVISIFMSETGINTGRGTNGIAPTNV